MGATEIGPLGRFRAVGASRPGESVHGLHVGVWQWKEVRTGRVQRRPGRWRQRLCCDRVLIGFGSAWGEMG